MYPIGKMFGNYMLYSNMYRDSIVHACDSHNTRLSQHYITMITSITISINWVWIVTLIALFYKSYQLCINITAIYKLVTFQTLTCLDHKLSLTRWGVEDIHLAYRYIHRHTEIHTHINQQTYKCTQQCRHKQTQICTVGPRLSKSLLSEPSVIQALLWILNSFDFQQNQVINKIPV